MACSESRKIMEHTADSAHIVLNARPHGLFAGCPSKIWLIEVEHGNVINSYDRYSYDTIYEAELAWFRSSMCVVEP